MNRTKWEAFSLRLSLASALFLHFSSGSIDAQNFDEDILRYEVRFLPDSTTPLLEVSFSYLFDKNGKISLKYENDSWGDQNIFNCIEDIHIVPKEYRVELIPDSNQIIISGEPLMSCRIKYWLKQDVKGPVLNQHRYRPLIEREYFHILGMRLLMIPEAHFEYENSESAFLIKYRNSDSSLTYHSSFGKSRNLNLSINREELYASIFVGGDFRISSFQHRRDTIFFLTRGEWIPFDDQDIIQILSETVKSQREFWVDPRDDNFTVTLIPTNEPFFSIGGSGFTGSFMSLASNNANTTLEEMRWLYNHELLHRWIGRTIINENDVQQYWFSEGFTDYYAFKLMLRYGFLSTDEFIETLNQRVLEPHFHDSLNSIPNSSLNFEKYWRNYAKYMKLPYRRGCIYAFMLDNQIKQNGSSNESLDDVVLELFWKSLEDNGFRLNDLNFLELIKKYIDEEKAQSDFDAHILRGELVDLSPAMPNGLSFDMNNYRLELVNPSFSELEEFLKR